MRNPMSEFTRNQIDQYVETGCPVGGFLSAVLENNLQEALGRADNENLNALITIAEYVYCRVPSQCWGSRERVATWQQHGGARMLEVDSEVDICTPSGIIGL